MHVIPPTSVFNDIYRRIPPAIFMWEGRIDADNSIPPEKDVERKMMVIQTIHKMHKKPSISSKWSRAFRANLKYIIFALIALVFLFFWASNGGRL